MNPANILLIALLTAPPAFAQKAAPQIPIEFHGVWAMSKEECRAGGDQIVIRKEHIVGIGGESGWTLKRIQRKDRQAFTGLYDFSGEGFEEFNITIALHRISKRKLRFDKESWVYCRRHF